jgi:biopolymer transport protein ExbB
MTYLVKKFLAILCPLCLLCFPLFIHCDSLPMNGPENALPTAHVENASVKPTGQSASTHSLASLNLKEIFSAAPVIYTVLLCLSIIAFTLWIYALLTFRGKDVLLGKSGEDLKRLLIEKKYEAALAFCRGQKKSIIAKLLYTAISSRHHGAQYVVEAMKAEGKRATSSIWQKISLLNDIVIVSPMLGLLGTVLGMFYAFYDLNRSAETLSTLFDGLGIAVGSTVTGLIVAILSMLFATTLKYRAMKALSLMENEAIALSNPLLSKDNL